MSCFKKVKHDWELIDTQIMPSAHEQLITGGSGVKQLNGNIIPMFQKCLVQTFKCKLTGEIRIERTYNPKDGG